MADPLDIQYNIWAILSATMREGSGISLRDLDDLPAIAYNGEKKCDVLTGPCACGTWHELDDARDFTILGKVLIDKHKIS